MSARCYVVMNGPDAASAAVVIDGSPPKLVREFLRKHAGAEIRTVDVEESRRLLVNYFTDREIAAARSDPRQMALL